MRRALHFGMHQAGSHLKLSPDSNSALIRRTCGVLNSWYLSKLIVSSIILLDVVLSEPLDGLRVVHPLKWPLGGLKILGGK